MKLEVLFKEDRELIRRERKDGKEGKKRGLRMGSRERIEKERKETETKAS